MEQRDVEPAVEHRFSLSIHDFECESEVISQLLGVQPTSSWVTGYLIVPAGTRRHKSNGWSVTVKGPVVDGDPENALLVMLRQFKNVGAFKKLPPACDVEMRIGIIGNRERPSFHLPGEAVRILGAMGASVDFDPYDFSVTESAR